MDDNVYMNLEELHGAAGGWSSENSPASSHSTKGTSDQNTTRMSHYQRSQLGQTEKVIQGSEVNEAAVEVPLSSSFEPVEEREHGQCQKSRVVCVSLLCFLLLATVTALSVQYHRDIQQLSRDLTNQTAEKQQLLLRYHGLRQERDELNVTYMTVMKEAVKCPSGWTQFGCSCYLLENSKDSWDSSRSMCQRKGGDLVIITSMEEMMFLNKLGAHLKFWIGLSKTSSYSVWMWTNGQNLQNSYWRSRHPGFSSKTQQCAAFNSFSHLSLFGSVQSWTAESCSQSLQRVCEKKTSKQTFSELI